MTSADVQFVADDDAGSPAGGLPSAPPVDRPAEPETSALRRYLTLGWVITIVVFTLARVWAARETLQGKGLNIWIFGFIDLVTAVPYAIGVAKVVTAMIDRRPAQASRWGAVAVASFFAPYLYIVWAGREHEFPAAVYVGLGVLVLVFGGNAVWKIVRQVRAGRHQQQAATVTAGSTI